MMMYLILVLLAEVYMTLGTRNPFFDQRWDFWHHFDAHDLRSTCIIFPRFADGSVAMPMLFSSEELGLPSHWKVRSVEHPSAGRFLLREIFVVGSLARSTEERFHSISLCFISLYMFNVRASPAIIPVSSDWGATGFCFRQLSKMSFGSHGCRLTKANESCTTLGLKAFFSAS